MSYEFKKISEVEVLETVSDEAHVLVEEDGAVKRVPKTEVGGSASQTIYYRPYGEYDIYKDEECTIKPTATDLEEAVNDGIVRLKYLLDKYYYSTRLRLIQIGRTLWQQLN